MSAFLSFHNELSTHDVDVHPAELHGLLVGYLCAVKDTTMKQQRTALYNQWADGEMPVSLVGLLEAAYASTLESLDEYSDFDFALLLPDDDQPIHERARSLALWCSGFLSGFGESGRQLDSAENSDVKEALQDLGRIAAMTDDVPEAEENEVDLNEIVEFVRVSTLLVYAETSAPGAH